MADLYFRHTTTNRRYKIVRLDKETKRLVLQGDTSEFDVAYDKEAIASWGYVLEKEEVDV